MIHILSELAATWGPNPGLVIRRNVSNPVQKYEYATDRILLDFSDHPYAEQVFCLLHEYRHAIQAHSAMFPEIYFTDWRAECKYREDYFNLPWERDANSWAFETGKDMGFFSGDFSPRWLQ